jgi:pimeloyl-ACP methyl ester carboxylesterase
MALMQRFPAIGRALGCALLGFLLQPAFAEYADVNGLRMYYEVHGQGRPLVLLHGGMSTIATSFSKQTPVLARNHRVIAIEQMAHGHTPDVPGRELSYERMCEDTASLLQVLGIRNADLVGWSDGGQIALRLAFTHPELVRRVVVSGVGLGPHAPLVKRLAEPGVADLFPEGRADYARVSPDGPEHWSVYIEKVRVMWAKPSWGFSERDLTAIKAPVLVVVGDHEGVPIEETTRIFHAIPKAELCILPGTGHATFQSRPDWLNPILLDFLDRD